MNAERPTENIIGQIESVIFRSDETGYAVLRVDIGEENDITVVGCIPYAAPGETISAIGSWSNHATHGLQFKAESCSRRLPDTAESIYDFLCSGCIKGIGPATAALIVNRFSANSLNIIENYPERLAEIKGISKQKANEILTAAQKSEKEMKNAALTYSMERLTEMEKLCNKFVSEINETKKNLKR